MLTDPINISFGFAGEGHIKVLTLSQITVEARAVHDFKILYTRTFLKSSKYRTGMSVVFVVCVILSISCQFTFAHEKAAVQRGTKLKYALFVDHPFYSLRATTIETAFVESVKHCLLRCVKHQQCFSINVAASKAQNGSVLCELLSSDKYNHSEKFALNGSFHHYSILVSTFVRMCWFVLF